MQNSACLGPEFQVSMGPSPHLSVFECQTASFGPELQVSMGPRPHLWIVCTQNGVTLQPEYTSLYWFQTFICVFCACKTACFRTRLTSLYGSQASSCGFVQCKSVVHYHQNYHSLYGSQHFIRSFCAIHTQRDFTSKTYKSLWVPDFICGFVNAHITVCLAQEYQVMYGSQPSSVDLCIQNIDFITMNYIDSMGSRPRLWICALQNSDF